MLDWLLTTNGQNTIDASHAMSYLIKKNFPECKIIMCYFHLRSNIRNQKSHLIRNIPKSEYFTIMEEINIMRMCLNQTDFNNLLEKH